MFLPLLLFALLSFQHVTKRGEKGVALHRLLMAQHADCAVEGLYVSVRLRSFALSM